MFAWYRGSEVCYAYLSDVHRTEHFETHYEAFQIKFRRSKWFTRGWTLQELLAPPHLEFYNSAWELMGTKISLGGMLSRITGIEDLERYNEACVAQKMSWASKRETTRIEDQAYSLMGLFGVNMPPLYGEGSSAFLRLQLKILRTSDDETIFAWQQAEDVTGSLLATSPKSFELSGSIQHREIEHGRPAYMMTNKGLRLESHLLPTNDPDSLLGIHGVNDTFLLPLQCILTISSTVEMKRVALRLRGVGGDQFARISSGALILMDDQQQEYLKDMEKSEERTVILVKQWESAGSRFQGPYHFCLDPQVFFSLKVAGLSFIDTYVSNPGRAIWRPAKVSDLGNKILPSVLSIDTLAQQGITAALLFAYTVEASRKTEDDAQHDGSFLVLILSILNHSPAVTLLTPTKIETPVKWGEILRPFFERAPWKKRKKIAYAEIESGPRGSVWLASADSATRGSYMVHTNINGAEFKMEID